MKYKSTQIYVLALIFFGIYIYYGIIYENSVIIDDLSLLRDTYILKSKPEGFFDFIINFVSSDVMNARPLSGFVTGCLIFISQYNFRLYFLSYLFFFLSVFSIFKLLKLYYNSLPLAILGATLFSLIPVASVIQFSPIMLNANLSIFFYCYSLLYLYKKNTKSYIISSLFFIFSFLCYEVFLPFIIINIILINNKNFSFKNFIISVSPIIFYIIYKNIIAPYVFINANHRETPVNIFDIERNIKIVKLASRAYLIDFPVSIKKAILGIKYYSIFDCIAIGIFNLSLFLFIKPQSFQVKNFKNRNNFIVLCLVFLLANSIYLFSGYRPLFFDFDNRTMAGVRVAVVVLAINLFLMISKSEKFQKFIFTISIAILSIFCVSAKNAWNYANDFNNQLFSQIKDKLPKNKQYKNVYIFYDYYKEKKFNPHLVMREPIYSNHYETFSLCKRNNIDTPFTGKPFFTKNKTTTISENNLDPDFTKFPYLIFAKSKQKMYIINCFNDYRIFLSEQ